VLSLDDSALARHPSVKSVQFARRASPQAEFIIFFKQSTASRDSL